MEIVHTPVMLETIVRYLAPQTEGEFLVDATLGEGGYSAVFLDRFPSLTIAGVDADEEIQAKAKERLASYGSRIRFFRSWAGDFFASYPSELPRPDKIIFDLGISLYHYKAAGRGFSFMRDEPLDMRLDTAKGKTASEIIRDLSEKDLADLLYNNAGERFSRRIARAIKQRMPVTTTGVLAEVIASSVPAAYRRGPIHPATRSFMALRMAVNNEMENLPVMLDSALHVLKTGGRMAVVTFHSGEDRVVKNYFREKGKPYSRKEDTPIYRKGGVRTASEGAALSILTRKPLTACEEEKKSNPPSRSAKLRVVEKNYETGVPV